MNAKLPRSMKQETIADMGIGESKYTVPWAMWADEDEELWLTPEFVAYDEPGGTVQMRITRTEAGFRVLRAPGHMYTPQPGKKDGGLPVVELDIPA